MVLPVVREGTTLALDRDMSAQAVLAHWVSPDKTVFVAEGGEGLLGTCYVRANQGGGGAHVANASYVTALDARGRGVARAMGEHSLIEARRMGFAAMQFNFVVSSNAPAVRLWQSLGFVIVGTLPRAFGHPTLGRVDALVMFRDL